MTDKELDDLVVIMRVVHAKKNKYLHAVTFGNSNSKRMET